MSTPTFGQLNHVLINQGGAAWGNDWICTSVTGTGTAGTYVYGRYDGVGTTPQSKYDIKFVNDEWLDGSSVDIPTHFGTSASDGTAITPDSTHEYLYLYHSPTQLLATLKNDGYSSTGTEGFSYSGTLTVNGNDLEWVIPSSSSSGTYYLLSGVNNTFGLELPITVGSNGATGSAPNFDQTKTWLLRSPTEDELDRISLTRTKKVHSNFW